MRRDSESIEETTERRGRQTYKKGSGGVYEMKEVRRDNHGIMSFSKNELKKGEEEYRQQREMSG